MIVKPSVPSKCVSTQPPLPYLPPSHLPPLSPPSLTSSPATSPPGRDGVLLREQGCYEPTNLTDAWRSVYIRRHLGRNVGITFPFKTLYYPEIMLFSVRVCEHNKEIDNFHFLGRYQDTNEFFTWLLKRATAKVRNELQNSKSWTEQFMYNSDCTSFHTFPLDTSKIINIFLNKVYICGVQTLSIFTSPLSQRKSAIVLLYKYHNVWTMYVIVNKTEQ